MNIKVDEKYYYFVPTIFALILALIITLSNNFPLSWDIYTHVNYALAYLHNGFTNVDYLLNAPQGKTIGYPPLFHWILILVSTISNNSLINSAKILQVLLSAFNVFTLVYVAGKIFDKKVGFFSGILLISSFMFTRFLLPIPETLAMVFFTLAVYSYYKASVGADYRFSLLSSLFSLLTLATHFSTFVYLMILLVVLVVVQIIILKSFDAIEYYLYIVIPLFLFGILSLVVLYILSPSYLFELLKGLLSIVVDPFNLLSSQIAMGLERYVRCIGLLPLLFSLVGLYYSLKKRELLFISCWAFVSFVISNLHWFGIPVYTFRLLIYLIIPLVILGAYGISNIFEIIKSSNISYAKIFVVVLIILSFVIGFVHITDSSVQIYSSSTEESTYQIAPPTSDEIEIINYFEGKSTENKSVLINNLFFGTVISSVDNIPLHYEFDVYTNKSLTKSSLNSLNEEKIGYIVYDKSLIINNSSNYDKLDVKFVNGSYYPTYYFTNEINNNNFNNIKLQVTEKTFENDRFIICKVI